MRAMILRPSGILDLDDPSLLPGIGTGIDGRSDDIGPGSFFRLAVDAHTTITRLDHLWIGLAVGSKSHHQLRDTQR